MDREEDSGSLMFDTEGEIISISILGLHFRQLIIFYIPYSREIIVPILVAGPSTYLE